MNNFSDLTIIIPTLNEVDNIKKLINLLTRRYKGVKIIVSDDGSDDGTKKVVIGLAKTNKKIRFLDRKAKSIHGLTASVLDGAMIANTKKIIIMDADMQHPYEKVGQISKSLDKNDLVIGVRSRVKNWGLYRRIMSKGMSYLVYIVFKLRGMPTCNDMMSGFFGIRTQLFKSLIKNNKKTFAYKGYKVLLDTLRIINKDERIGEIYYDTFHDREQGKSKMGMNQVVNTLKSTFR